MNLFKKRNIVSDTDVLDGEVFYYTGDIPEKNLKELEEFKLDETDEVWCENYGTKTKLLTKFSKRGSY